MTFTFGKEEKQALKFRLKRQATHNHSTICYSTQQDNLRTRFSAEMMADIEFRVSQAEEDRVLT